MGGDWFDGFCTADDVTVLAIGDTVGHDIAAGITALAATLGGLQDLPADATLDRVLDPVRCDREDTIAALAIRVEG